LTWLAARSSRKRWAVACRAPRKGQCGKRGQTRRAHGFKRAARSRRARIGRSRDVPARPMSVAEVDRRRRTQRSVHSPFHPIWIVHGDGSLACSPQASAKSAARRLRVKGRRGPNRSGNPSRDRYSRSVTTRAGARVSPIDGRHLGLQWLTSSSRRGLLRGLGGPKKPRSCESAAKANGEATGVSEARLVREWVEKYATHQPERPAKADRAS